MKYRKIVFVCTGNTCRSPMAEAALRAELKKRKIKWCRVSSAGLHAQAGSAMSVKSAQALSEAGIGYSETFNARQITAKMVEEAYAVVCLSEAHRHALGDPPNATSFRLLCGTDIPDPYGQSVEVYRETLARICACMPRVIEGLRLEDAQSAE